MRTLRPILVLALATFMVFGCSEDDSASDDGALGSVSLFDSTDGTGKADVIAGRNVNPKVTGLEELVGDNHTGVITVSDLTDRSMAVEGPLITFDAQEKALQITVDSDGNSGETVLRFVLAYKLDRDETGYTPLTLEGLGIFEDEDDVEAETEGTETGLQLSFYQSVSILTDENNSITVASDESNGQTTAELPFNGAEAEWAIFVIPVDSGWEPLDSDFNYKISASCNGGLCATDQLPPEPADAYAQARDVTLAAVSIAGDAPTSYNRVSVERFGLGGTEFWQKWDGGHSPTFSFSEGTDNGRKCMQASAIRFEAIMADPPPAMIELLDNTNWSGRFFNWNDDYTEAPFGDASGAKLWAWRTGLIKWISQTGKDGTCFLPTLSQVERAAASCLSRGNSDDGEIQGCSAR